MDAARHSRIVVTGATGFIGRRLVAQLQGQGADVHPVSLRSRDDALKTVRAVRPQRVVHLGGFTDIGASWTDPAGCIEANVQATVDLLRALDDSCERLVFASTADVYGNSPVPMREDGPTNPLSPYAISKLAAEQFCLLASRAGGPPAVILRLFNAFGPGQPVNRVVPDVIRSALLGNEIAMTEGRQRRDFTYVDDVVDAMVAALWAPGADGSVINVGSGSDVSIREIAERILGLMGNPVVARFGAKPERAVEVPVISAHTERAAALLGWKATRTLDAGLRETIDWYRSQPLTVDGA